MGGRPDLAWGQIYSLWTPPTDVPTLKLLPKIYSLHWCWMKN